MFLHEDYKKRSATFRYNDVALIQLDQPVEVNDYVRPICLPHSVDTVWPSPKARCYMAGWGYTNVDISEYSTAQYTNYGHKPISNACIETNTLAIVICQSVKYDFSLSLDKS